MRFLLAVLIFTCVSSASAQDRLAIPLDEMEAYGISIERLDSLHRSAVHTDPDQAVFAGRDEEVIAAWRELLKSLNAHLREGGFTMQEPLRGYYRFYFSPGGTVDRVLYDVPALEDEPVRIAAFGALLDSFAKSYQFRLSADEPFAQCSPAVLRPT